MRGYFTSSTLLSVFLVCTNACGSSGDGGGGGSSSSGSVPEKPGKILKSAKILPKAGGLVDVTSQDPALSGAALSVPAHAVDKETTISMGVLDAVPLGAALGQAPLGKVFTLTPSGTTFSIPAKLGLPIPAGADRSALYVGVYNPATKGWDNLGGEVKGDFISTSVPHLSTYGVFSGGKSTVQFINNSSKTGAGNTLIYSAGPVPLPTAAGGAPFPANPPAFMPGTLIEFKAGEARNIDLAPGEYDFLFTYPSPQPGIANHLYFAIPPLSTGTDDGQIDQTITLTDSAATSDNPITQASIRFPGNAPSEGSNLRPIMQCDAAAPPGIVVSNGESTTAPLPSRIVSVGPIKVEAFKNDAKPLTFAAMGSDPEGGNVTIFWTILDPATGQSHVATDGAPSGAAVHNQAFNPTRGGNYVVYATVYDNIGLFDECHWNINVVPNTPPTLRVAVDDVVIDFGRLDQGPDKRVVGIGPDVFGSGATAATSLTPLLGLPGSWPQGFASGATGPGGVATFFPSTPISFPPGLVPWSNICGYVDTTSDGVADTTVLKLLPMIEGDLGGIEGLFPNVEHARPLQYPGGMTCVFALVADADGDPIKGGFELPVPIFGEGNVYAAISIPAGAPGMLMPDGSPVAAHIPPEGLPVGAAIDNQEKMDAYNAAVSAAANAGLLPCQFGADGALLALGTPGPCSALPIVFESPDDPDPALTVHDCRHLSTCATLLPRGGTINVEGRVTDGFSPEIREFGVVAYPDVESVFPGGLTLDLTPNPADPGPGESVTVTACIFPPRSGVVIDFAIVGTDQFTSSASPATGASGCADFVIPGGAKGVVDVVTVTVKTQATVTQAVTSNVSYTF